MTVSENRRSAVPTRLHTWSVAADVAATRLRTVDEVRGVLADLHLAARSEVLAMLPVDDISRTNAEVNPLPDVDAIRRGVAGYLISDSEWATDPEKRDELRRRVDAGARVRIADRVPHALMMFDRRVAILSVETTPTTAGALVIRERSMIATLHTLFTQVWYRSRDLSVAGDERRSTCTPRDRLVLELMSRGVTDEAAARQLAMSLRTYRRWVAEVMNSLGATSRFQAGVRAAERGWLSPGALVEQS
jgi:DNA-binding NarL/FixJ family response regulator